MLCHYPDEWPRLVDSFASRLPPTSKRQESRRPDKSSGGHLLPTGMVLSPFGKAPVGCTTKRKGKVPHNIAVDSTVIVMESTGGSLVKNYLSVEVGDHLKVLKIDTMSDGSEWILASTEGDSANQRTGWVSISVVDALDPRKVHCDVVAQGPGYLEARAGDFVHVLCKGCAAEGTEGWLYVQHLSDKLCGWVRWGGIDVLPRENSSVRGNGL